MKKPVILSTLVLLAMPAFAGQMVEPQDPPAAASTG